jgi:hypothetical protein
MNSYLQLKQKQQKEVEAFPMVFAFSNKQFEEGMKKLGLKPEDTDKVYSLKGTGGFYRRSDAKILHDMLNRHIKEMDEAISADLTGDGFIYEMFNYELSNHEYVVTGDITDTVRCLDLTIEEINNDKRLLHGLKKACKYQEDWYRKNN